MLARLLRCFDNPAALLAVVVAVLMSLGIVMVYSASGARAGVENIRVAAREESRADEDYRFHHGSDYLVKQAMWALLGIAVGGVLLRVPVETLERYAWPVLIITFFVLILVVASPLGVESKGAKRWLRLGSLTVQPSEFSKIGLVIFMAKLLADKREKMKSIKEGFLPAVAVLGIYSILILLEKDLGNTVLMGTVMVGMWCLAQVRFRHLAVLVLLALPAMVYLVFQHSYRVMRVLAFMNPEQYSTTFGYQLDQSLIAVGSGGIMGSGLGFGLQKYHFLSEAHTDFIFAIACEELGLIGAGAICLLFLLFVILGFQISYRAPDYFSGLVAAGLTMVVGCAAFMNFFVVLGMAPTKGLPLPFFSYGGSSMMASLIAVAILINISNYSVDPRGTREAV